MFINILFKTPLSFQSFILKVGALLVAKFHKSMSNFGLIVNSCTHLFSQIKPFIFQVFQVKVDTSIAKNSHNSVKFGKVGVRFQKYFLQRLLCTRFTIHY